MNIKKIVVTALVAVMVMCGTAFASQPFADVPADSWAISAVQYLSARGLIAGYPDGQFKGDKPATRYEVATAVSKAYASLDATKATKEDVEVLKKLAVEFADELKALGVKTEDLDKRVTVLEKGVGGWDISGNLMFDMRENSGDNSKTPSTAWSHTPGSSYWGKAQAYINLNKKIDENTMFISQFRFGEWADKYSNDKFKDYGKGDSNSFAVWKMYVKTKLPVFKGTDFRVGRFDYDFEEQAGLIADAHAMFGGGRTDGFRFDKVWNKFDATVLVGRNSSADYNFYPYVRTDFNRANTNAYLFALNGKYDFTDRSMLGFSGYFNRFDNKIGVGTVGAYGRYYLNPERTLGLQGAFYWQKASTKFDVAEVTAQSHTAFKATFFVKQEQLKFTDLWIEYADMSNGFAGGNLGGNYQSMNSYTAFDTASQASLLNNKPLNEKRTNLWFIKLQQQWKNPKWSTFERYAHADFNTTGVDNADEWTVGVNYKMTPAIKFTLGYSTINYGDGVTSYKGTTAFGNNSLKNRDNVVLFRTAIDF